MLGASMIITVIVCGQSRQRLFVGKVGKGRLRRGCVAAPRLVPAQLQSPQVPRDPRRRPWQTLEITIHATQSIELEPQVLTPKYCWVKCKLLYNPKPKIFNPKFPTKKTHKHRKHFLVHRVSVGDSELCVKNTRTESKSKFHSYTQSSLCGHPRQAWGILGHPGTGQTEQLRTFEQLEKT